MKISKKISIILFIVFSLLVITSCVPGANELVNVQNKEEPLAGFFMGIWHGMIVVISFIISLFKDNVSVYEVHNAGHLYDLGFLFGISIVFGGGGAGAKKRSRRRD